MPRPPGRARRRRRWRTSPSLRRAAISSSRCSTAAGGRSRAASALAAARSCAITVAASAPWPMASPTISALRPLGSGMMSHQSPPTIWPPGGWYRCVTSIPSGVARSPGSRPRCRASAIRCSLRYSRALSMLTAATADSSRAMSTSRSVNRPAAVLRPKTRNPCTRPRVVSGTHKNHEWPAAAQQPRGAGTPGRLRHRAVQIGEANRAARDDAPRARRPVAERQDLPRKGTRDPRRQLRRGRTRS